MGLPLGSWRFHLQRPWVVRGAGFRAGPRAEGLAWLLQTSACDAEFCANLHPLHQQHGPSKDDGQRLHRVGTCRAEAPEARHRLRQLSETASEFGSPTLEESNQRQKGDDPKSDQTKEVDANLPGWQPKETRPNCHTTAGPTAKTTPLL